MAKEKAAKAAKLTIVYQQREQLWQQAQTEAARACASAYDQVADELHQLAEAYQLNNNTLAFQHRFQRFIDANNGRKALLKRLADLME
ncbi:hypothetical protein L9G15_13700 [Shewanella sp. A3A]|nr:hypothetical protein [Shewanella ferrihydritica]